MSDEDDLNDLMQLAEMVDMVDELEAETEPFEIEREMLEDGTRIVYMSNGGRIVTNAGGKYIYDGDDILVEHQTPSFMGLSVTRQYDPNEVGFGPDDDIDNEDAVATASTTKIRMRTVDDKGLKTTITQVREGDVERDGVDAVMSNKPLMTKVQAAGISIYQGPDGKKLTFANPYTGKKITMTGKEADKAIKAGGLEKFVANKISAQFKPMGS